MKRFRKTKKLAALLSAISITCGASYAACPAPAAEAGWGNIIGAVVQGAAASSQLDKQIKYYNNTEEGRQEYFQMLKEKYGVSDNENLHYRLDNIMGTLSSAIAVVDPSIKEKPYNYFVNQDDSFNAFCTMGHNVSVNQGLFSALTNEDEIAVVVAHEMGHGQSDHPAKGAKRSIGPAVLASAAGGNIAAVLVANAIQNQGITKPMEWEADNLAFEYISHSPYNLGATAAIWQHVIDTSKGGGSNPLAMIMTGGSDHPSEKSRRDNYVKKMEEYSGKHVTCADGKLKVNGKDFMTPAPVANMSSAERAYLVMGNLAAAYHNNHAAAPARAEGATVYLGAQSIMTCTANDEPASVLVERLNRIK